MTHPLHLILLLATAICTACIRPPQGLSAAEQPILDRIRQVRELRTAAAEHWPGFDDARYETPLLYLTDSVCYAVNPGPAFRERFGARRVLRTADFSLYKTALPDSLPFHMETQFDFSDSTAFNHSIPYLFCSSPERTRLIEPSVVSDTLWFPMVLHEYAHGYQFRQVGYAEAFRTTVADTPEKELAALHKRHDWHGEAVRRENRALLEALNTPDDDARDAFVRRFKELRQARKRRMSTELGDSIVRSGAVYEAMEGMARFVEARAGFAMGCYSGADDWLWDTDRAGYFFATGYNLIRLLERCGTDRSSIFATPLRPLEDFLTTQNER